MRTSWRSLRDSSRSNCRGGKRDAATDVARVAPPMLRPCCAPEFSRACAHLSREERCCASMLRSTAAQICEYAVLRRLVMAWTKVDGKWVHEPGDGWERIDGEWRRVDGKQLPRKRRRRRRTWTTEARARQSAVQKDPVVVAKRWVTFKRNHPERAAEIERRRNG